MSPGWDLGVLPALVLTLIYGRSGSWFLGDSGTPSRAQEVGEVVGVAPVLHYLAIRYAEHVHRAYLNPLASKSQALEDPPGECPASSRD